MHHLEAVIGLSPKLKPAIMRHNQLLICTIAVLICSSMSAQQLSASKEKDISSSEVSAVEKKQQLNFFVVSKRHKGKIDPASRFNVLRTKLKSLVRPGKFVSIVARNAEEASESIEYRLQKHNARIGTLWLDSHGMYKKGYSVFFIGQDEYSYKTVNDSMERTPLQRLVDYTDEETSVIIGSCYGGATYYRASIDYKDTTRMNGDSLMIGLGKIFNRASIYACESWVMTKPGLFLQRAAVAGHPLRKLFRDVCYRPAWESMGKWNQYNAATNEFKQINPVTLDMYGNVIVRTIPYTDQQKVRKEIEGNMKKLKPWLYK